MCAGPGAPVIFNVVKSLCLMMWQSDAGFGNEKIEKELIICLFLMKLGYWDLKGEQSQIWTWQKNRSHQGKKISNLEKTEWSEDIWWS